MPFSWPVRVYYEDTDAGGVVFYANYLRYMERARTEWLRSLGIEQDQLRSELGIIFVVVSCEVRYRRPARFNEQLQVTVSIVERRKASLTFRQQVRRGDRVLVEGLVRAATVDDKNFRPQPLPAAVTEVLE